MAPAIAAHDVAFAPPGSATPVISGVTLEIARGEWVALAGPNGSGKTTLALGLAGLVPLRRGRVERATGRGPAGGLRVATILQEPATQATQPTVREEIAFTAINLGVDRVHAFEQALRWSRILDLDPLLDLAPGALSAGQLQKVLFAAAFATDPELLIADEAAAHLDARERQRVLELVRVRVAEGLAVLWITQREEDHAWSDRVVVLPGPEPHTGGTARSVREELYGPETGVTIRVRVRVAPGGEGRVRISGDVMRTIEFDRPGVWAVTGPNGSGKTSLLEALAGVVTIPGVDVEWFGAHEPGPILAGQYPDRQIFEELVAREIRFAAVQRGVPIADAEQMALRMLAGMGLPESFAGRRTWSLSAGEKRVVSAVGSLMAPAPLVLLDEPTSGLDSTRRAALVTLVLDRARRTPVVIATQDAEWIGQVGAIEVSLE